MRKERSKLPAKAAHKKCVHFTFATSKFRSLTLLASKSYETLSPASQKTQTCLRPICPEEVRPEKCVVVFR
jgi:hypothetical protein